MSSPKNTIRKHLSGDALIQLLHDEFQQLSQPLPQASAAAVSLTDALLSGFAMFSLKDPSLLAFDKRRNDDNMRSIYRIEHVPSDTHMRTLLDEVETEQLRPAFCSIFRQLQRGKVLEPLVFFQGCYLLSIDGTEHFSSQKIHCAACLQRKGKGGQITFYHQMLSAAIVHPDCREVIPLMPEPIIKQDGATKNDCERNAARRFLEKFRKDHPHLPVIVVEDGLSSNGPHIADLKRNGMHFILGAKEGDHTFLFGRMESAFAKGEAHTLTLAENAGKVLHHFRYLLNVPLNESHPDLLVNFIEYWEISAEGIKYFSWVTDLPLTCDTVYPIMRGGRARWKIENETFNTLKNQGYHFEHNFGHGDKNLCVVFALLMMLAFFVDQVQQLCDPLFRAAWEKAGSKRQLWEEMRTAFRAFKLPSLRALYETLKIGFIKQRPVLADDSS
jgi:hypothetical protein